MGTLTDPIAATAMLLLLLAYGATDKRIPIRLRILGWAVCGIGFASLVVVLLIELATRIRATS